MPEINERFTNALHSTARSWRLAMDRRLKYLGLSQASWLTIAIVAKAPAPLSQIDLANRLGVEGATMVSMLDRLTKAGFLEREVSPSDRRVKRVKLTEAGNEVFGRVKAEATIFRDNLLQNFDRDKLAMATDLLKQLQSLVESEL